MRRRKLLLVLSFMAASLSVMAQSSYASMLPLHVDGNQLKDPAGNKVVLHGVMDTPSEYFNNYRWSGGYTDAGAKNCIAYFTKLFKGITSTAKGAYCNIFRLHLDCCWTNGANGSWEVDAREVPYNDKGEVDWGENNISRYEGARLTYFLDKVYTPIADRALRFGLYVIMRPPGVCPRNIYVGGSYQKYLLDVWDRVTKNEFVLKNYGVVSLELANEPIGVHNADGTDSDQALHDFFQPIVDKIRENGFKGIIWVPGTGYQSNYRSYAKYPITGDNIGYAVHNYAGWYDNSDSHCVPSEAIASFGKSVPIIRTNPIVITEVDWSPQNSNNIKNYNEMGQPVYGNYGTWATASTSKWGKAYKAILDYFGNISMTLTGTSDYIDIDDLIKNGKVTPAFKTAMEANGVDPYEACGVACFDWYEKYAQVDYPSSERYQPKQEVPENPFELSNEWFNPTILYEGSAKHTATMSTLTLKQGGCSGWRFDEEEGVDLSQYNYLIIKLGKNAGKNTFFRIYDTGNYWSEPYKLDMMGKKSFMIDLHDMKNADGETIDPSHIRIAGFNSAGADQTLYVSEVFLSYDGENPVTSVESPEAGVEIATTKHYSLDGRHINTREPGIHLVKYSNGTVKKVYIRK